MSLSDQYVKSVCKNIRSLPLKNFHSNEPNPSHLPNTNSVPNIKTLQNIFKETLFTNKKIICGKKVKVPFPGLGNFIYKIEKYNPASNTYTLSHPDGDWTDDMIFDDVVKLVPKSWLSEEHKAHVHAINCDFYEVLNTVNCLSASEMSNSNFTEPVNYKKTMMSDDSHYWVGPGGTCDTEMNTLNKMQFWDIVDDSTMSEDAEIIATKCILTLKFENDKYIRHKGRVVSKGYLQKRHPDFSSFSPTVSQVTLRVILVSTVSVGYKSWDLDATCASPPGKVLKVKKTIYDLIQTPLAFYQLCSKVYQKVGYTQLKSDECVFIHKEKNVKEGSKSSKSRKISTMFYQQLRHFLQ